MKAFINDTLTFLLGFLLCLYLTKSKCVDNNPVNYQVLDNTWIEHGNTKVDTFYKIIDVPVQKPKVIYKRIYEKSVLYQDTSLLKSLCKNTDTSYLVTVDSNQIEINHYQDSLFTDDYEVRWTAETFGYLTSLIQDVRVYKDNTEEFPLEIQPKEKRWAVNIGISQKLNYKTGLFYKGWGIECEFKTSQNKLDQIYFTKTVSF